QVQRLLRAGRRPLPDLQRDLRPLFPGHVAGAHLPARAVMAGSVRRRDRLRRGALSAAHMFAPVAGTATSTPSLIALVAVSLLIAGLVKGVIGVGMPVVAFPLLSMLVDVQTAVMLLSVPLVLSNIPQALEGGRVTQTLRRLAPVIVGMIPGVWI